MNVPAVDGGLLKPDVVEGTDDEVPYFVGINRTIPKGSVQSKDFKTKKIFVGGVPTTVSKRVDEFKNFFSKHGKVVEHQIIRDHNTNRSRGTPGLGGRLGGYGGYSGGSELGGGYGGFGGSGLGAYRGNAIRFESILCKTSVDSTAYIASLITILTGFSFFDARANLSLKGKNAAMVLCWLLGNGCLFAWNVMFLTLSAMYELLCVLLYAYVFGKLPIVKYYRAKAASEGARTVVADLAAGGIQTEHAKGNKKGCMLTGCCPQMENQKCFKAAF
ncbi:hypothetical protein Syun_000808 [Stephania yunnanensis]|uniref:RRM domain-containing protein n=2 Tax=Stephania yunnanensis TaxID=152371 RepID=A0AAP0Q6H5_9MAGN